MTRRERHLRIIENMGTYRTDCAIQSMLRRDKKFSFFTDEAVEELAAELVRRLRVERRLIEENNRTRKTAVAGTAE